MSSLVSFFYAHLDMLSLSCAILEMLSNFFMLMWTCYHFLQMSSDDSSDESDDFFKIVLSGAMLAQIYCDMYLDKNPPRTSTTSGMG